MTHIITNIFLLLCGHALADFALQTEWIAYNKNRNVVPKGYDPEKHGKLQSIWIYVLTSHALIHGLMVYLITLNIWFGIAETIIHWVVDFGKCEKWYGIHTDQSIHILCKIIWGII